MENCFANSKNDRHRVDVQKSKMDTFAAAMEGERPEGPDESREGPNNDRNEPNENVEDVTLESAPGSSTDIRIEPAAAAPPTIDLDEMPVNNSEPRVATPARPRATKRS